MSRNRSRNEHKFEIRCNTLVQPRCCPCSLHRACKLPGGEVYRDRVWPSSVDHTIDLRSAPRLRRTHDESRRLQHNNPLCPAALGRVTPLQRDLHLQTHSVFRAVGRLSNSAFAFRLRRGSAAICGSLLEGVRPDRRLKRPIRLDYPFLLPSRSTPTLQKNPTCLLPFVGTALDDVPARIAIAPLPCQVSSFITRVR